MELDGMGRRGGRGGRTLGPKSLREGLGTPGLSAFLRDGAEAQKGVNSAAFRSERLFQFPLLSVS